ncbi:MULTISPECIES: homoserine O-acetyltransferase MetX [Bacillaceae]|uniref:Homoserine O-acetyltransferase n=1 Tax=Evansella alkalicola TaxID=745819 RepID=A0ABS6JUF2_9BACI|nr:MULTISPECIES: homoserine O-acetyltransferase [Bacillaceae]MBU9722194.1 homoserine O-acetyltransferase [Bacillus alkalicola]
MITHKIKRSTGTITLPYLKLDSGEELTNVEMAYERAGKGRSDPILVCHALTGNQNTVGTEEEPGWWRGLIDYKGYIDLDKQDVITFNVLGGCNGSTGPTSIKNQALYGSEFPFITVRDMVRAQREALAVMGISHLTAVIGGSLGGMQALEWAVMYPELVDNLIVLAATDHLSDYGVAYNAIARKAIIEDPNWNDGHYTKDHFPSQGLSLARMIGLLTYRSDTLFNQRFHRGEKDSWGNDHKEVAYQVESYLLYQGEKFTKRFDPNSYLYLLKAMDHHDLEASRGPLPSVLSRFNKTVQLIGFQGDLLYPPEEMERLSKAWANVGTDVSFHKVETVYGHDGFLTEYDKWGKLVSEAIE